MSAVSMLISWNFPNTGAGVYASCRALPMRGALSDTAHANIFDLREFEDAVLRAFPTDSTLLDAAERRDLGGDESGVESDDAVFERLGDAPGAREIACVHVRGEPELGVIGEPHGFLVGVDAEQRRDGTKSFFARQGHLRVHVREHGRFVERSAECMALSSGDHRVALGFRICDVALQ